MLLDDSKRKFRHIPEIIMNLGKVELADQEIAEDYVEHIAMPPGFPKGRQGFKDFLMMLRTAFPDLHYDVDHLTTNDLVGENQKVVHRIVAHGTHKGPWGPIPATGKRMRWSEIHIGLYVQNVLVEHWGNVDAFGILGQMGAIPGWTEPPAALPHPTPSATTATSSQENVALVRRYIRDVWNNGKLDIANEVIHPGGIDAGRPHLPQGPAGARLEAIAYRLAFPNLHMFIEDVIADENAVVIRYTLAGTHEGTFMNVPPTGRDVEMGGCSIFRFGDGKIIERWDEPDILGLMGQLGVG